MKLNKTICIIFTLTFVLSFSSCQNNGVTDPATDTVPENINETLSLPEDFEFYLRWDCYGISSYDSASGKLVKTTDTKRPSDYTTTLKLTTSELATVYSILSELDLSAYPSEYDPHLESNGTTMTSSPPMTIVLRVAFDGNEYEIACENTAVSYSSNVPMGDKFLKACRAVINILTDSEEWKSLPEYEFFYE